MPHSMRRRQRHLACGRPPALVAWGEEPTLYVGAAQIKAFLREYAQ